MAYATPTDMVAQFSQATMNQLLPVAASVPPAFDTTRATVILASVSNFMDSYIGMRYQLPLAISPIPSQIKEACCDIAYYRMYSARPQNWIQDARQRFEDALAYLKDIARSNVTLGTTQAQDDALNKTPDITFSSPPRQFSKDPGQPTNAIQQFLRMPLGPGSG